MNVSYKRSIITSIIFGILFLYLVTIFVVIGPNQFVSNKTNMIITSIVIAVAMLSFAFAMLFTNKKGNIVDERDDYIQKKASSIGLMISLIYVFLLSIILFVINRNSGFIDVSWLWFIAYSTFAFGYFITSLIHVYVYHYESD